ncbi:hypothetical protein NBG4_1050004 [Candidatus Sulfobium mesophilum]|uniref:RACo C-terminal domain-containing protein n=1 Tax=Candidatus Sulfobium mesophilum TaxID=2016548 RepID=A0A2U3QE11_9BACT|nr:hypothetical protein NBG4_1050004 [Candidatus Sulfobium mesophilum]
MPVHNPAIKKRYLEIPEPSLSDTLGDCQRLLREIEKALGYKGVKVEFIGNGSIDGAMKALLSVENLEKTQQIAESVTTFELTREPSYYGLYTSALFLPHTDMSLFPTVKIK